MLISGLKSSIAHVSSSETRSNGRCSFWVSPAGPFRVGHSTSPASAIVRVPLLDRFVSKVPQDALRLEEEC